MVVRMWAWCLRRSKSAVVSFSSPENLCPLTEGEVSGDQCRADLVALGDDVEEKFPSGPFERHEPQLVEYEQVHPPQSPVQQDERPIVAVLGQVAHQVGGTKEGYPESTPGGLHAGRARYVGFSLNLRVRR